MIKDSEKTFIVELEVKESYLFFGIIEEQPMELSIKLNNPNYIEVSEAKFGLKVYQQVKGINYLSYECSADDLEVTPGLIGKAIDFTIERIGGGVLGNLDTLQISVFK